MTEKLLVFFFIVRLLFCYRDDLTVIVENNEVLLSNRHKIFVKTIKMVILEGIF